MHNRYDFPKIRVAAVQAASVFRDAPVWFDTEATLAKGIRLIEEAASNGARLIVFPETWLPGFPYWGTDMAEDVDLARGSQGLSAEMWAKYLWSSIEVPGKETDALCAAAKKANAFVVMGINERDKNYSGRMYNSMLYIDSNGQMLGTHRKICPTSNERLFHTPGDGGDNLMTVFNTEIGKIGGSICGEHAQLPLIYQWGLLGVQLHCSLWPGYKGKSHTMDLRTRYVCLSTHAYGILAAAYYSEEDRPKNFARNSYFNQPGRFRGGSAIISPTGTYITEPVFDRETIVYADVDLGECDKARHATNLSGIYSRWDIMNMAVRQERYVPVAAMTAEESIEKYAEHGSRDQLAIR